MPAVVGPPPFAECVVPLPSIVVVLLCLAVGLGPLTVYLYWLAAVNRRTRPLLLSGVWDFVLLLLGVGGLLLVGAWLALTIVQSDSRILARGNWQQIAAVWSRERLYWLAVAGAYAAVVGGAVAGTLWRRRRTLSVYAVGRAAAEGAVTEALADAGVPAARFGRVWSDGRDVAAIDPFHGFHHVLVRVLTRDDRLAEELLRAVRLRVAALPASPSSLAPWLFTACSMTGSLAFGSVALVLYFFFAPLFQK